MDTLCEAFQSLRLKDSAIFNWEAQELTCTKTKFDKKFTSHYEQKEISFIKELLPETFYSVWVIRPRGEIIDQGKCIFELKGSGSVSYFFRIFKNSGLSLWRGLLAMCMVIGKDAKETTFRCWIAVLSIPLSSLRN